MKQTTNYYDLLEMAQHAHLMEITYAYMRLSRELDAGNSPLPEADIEFRRQLLKHAYEVLSNSSRRSDYDAGLVTRGGADAGVDRALHVEVALESSKSSPIRR